MLFFGEYQLDPAQGLKRGQDEVRITPKSLSLLCLLAKRAGQVVTKEEIFRLVWPETAVSDSALTSCIQELRGALRDSVKRPRYIETLHRRGYRFVAHVSGAATQNPVPVAVPLLRADTTFVGRDAVIKEMANAWTAAKRGSRQILFITGEAGAGKTTTVSVFLERLAALEPVRATWAQCVQHFGVGEAYEPLLEAMIRLCRQPSGEQFLSILEQHAPTWLAQMPGLLPPRHFAELQRSAAGTTKERMLRELTGALEAITLDAPLILWLEDLQWSDVSTLDWISAFAPRPEPARLLLIGTVRSSDITGTHHRLASLIDNLVLKGLCHELVLYGLDESAIAEYVTLRFPCRDDQAKSFGRLAPLVQRHTAGNPLFVMHVFSDLVERGLLLEANGNWSLSGPIAARDLGIPESVRRAINGEIDQLSVAEQALLEVASVVGVNFALPIVATVLETSLREAEATLSSLAYRHRFVGRTQVLGSSGGVALGFSFLHVLYRDAFYQRIAPERFKQLHQRVGDCKERVYADSVQLIAAELAMHFELGRKIDRAVFYLQQAAQNARSRSAFVEARIHLDKALLLIRQLPVTRERKENEAILLVELGAIFQATHGWGAEEAEDAYSRAQTLLQDVGKEARSFIALWGLWLFSWGRGFLDNARDLAEDLIETASHVGDSATLVQAHHAAWATAFSRGDLNATLRHTDEGLRLYEEQRDSALLARFGNHDPIVCCHIFRAQALALLGRTEEATQHSNNSIEFARKLAHPFSQALTLVFASRLGQLLRDCVATRNHAAAAVKIACEQEFRLVLAWASALEGWAEAHEGQSEEGIQKIVSSIGSVRAISCVIFQPHLLGLLAETRLKAGQVLQAMSALEEALNLAVESGERVYDAELLRLKGELRLVTEHETPCQAEGVFRDSLEVSKTQNAHLFTLRTVVSLARLWIRSGKHQQARELISRTMVEEEPLAHTADYSELVRLLSE
ncbi:MAG TPA: AAA family ATPase [Terriglobales bacterium]|nr:AAA family ATPase [Terriglobales bacterium]